MYSFDFSSGYHHINIFEPHQTFLGFAWNGTFYKFTVLPFGLSTAGHVFTKVVRVLVKKWREMGIQIVVFLDDGFGSELQYEVAYKHSQIVHKDLILSRFIPNYDKSIWIPKQILKWLGFIFNLVQGCIQRPEKKIKNVKIITSKALEAKFSQPNS